MLLNLFLKNTNGEDFFGGYLSGNLILKEYRIEFDTIEHARENQQIIFISNITKNCLISGLEFCNTGIILSVDDIDTYNKCDLSVGYISGIAKYNYKILNMNGEEPIGIKSVRLTFETKELPQVNNYNHCNCCNYRGHRY